jgi:predicted transposase YdaD
LLPYTVLSRASDKERVLAQVVEELDRIADSREQSNLAAATSILAGLQLEEETIRRLMRNPVMRESTMYQSILREGEAQGRTAEGRNLVLKLLTRKLGNLSISQREG